MKLIKLLIVFTLFISPLKSNSCSCGQGFWNKTVEHHFIENQFSTKVRIIGIKDTTIIDSSFNLYNQQSGKEFERGFKIQPSYMTVCQGLIIDTYKGELLSGDTIQIFTGRGNGDCGFHFELDSTYLIFSKPMNLYETISTKAVMYHRKVIQYTDDCYGTIAYNYLSDRKLKYLHFRSLKK